jgi:ADP-heptose:LPS heptosyltransferase
MSRPVDFAQVRNVLILRTDHLGDLLLSTPLIRKLRTALPDRRFTLVASPANAQALEDWDAIDEILVYDARWSLRQKWRFLQELWLTSWDLCLTLSPRTVSYILGRLSGAPVRAGLVYSRRVLVRLLSPLWLTHTVVSRVDEQVDAGEVVPHEVLQLAEIARVLGLPDDPPGRLEIPRQPAAQLWAQDWLAAQGAPATGIIGIHGAFKWLSAGWTAADFLLLVQTIHDLPGVQKVLLTFGPGDKELQAEVEAFLTKDPDAALLLPGQLPVAKWAALVSHCDVFVSPDTGSLHLGVALGKPVVALYEARKFAHCSAQWAPWQVEHAIVRRESPDITVPLLAREVQRLRREEGLTNV